MSSTLSWLQLPLPPSASLPALMVSMATDTAAYTLHVTDMANVWTESLERKAICIRGWSENTSIDPSDTPDNMTRFLKSLKAALDPLQPGHEQTSLSLMQGANTDAEDGGLVLGITCELPGMQPLKWPFYLKKVSPSVIASTLVFPLIQAQFVKRQQVESMSQLVTQKDTIITKLLDKLEAMGIGLEHIFNPLSGRKKISRHAAAEKVPGLAPFDHRVWQSELAKHETGPNNADSLISEVFGGEGLHAITPMAIETPLLLDKWWQDFSKASSTSQQSQTRAASSAKTTRPPVREVPVDDDDDFQVQSTPPHLHKSQKPLPVGQTELAGADTDTASEGDDSLSIGRVSPPVSPKPQRNTETTKSGPRLGTLGRNKQAPPAAATETTQKTPETSVPGPQVVDLETESEAEDDGTTASLPDNKSSKPQSLPKAAATKKSGMGRIGGSKPKTPAEPATQESLSGPEGTRTTNPQDKPAPKKLGIIGKKKGNDASPGLTADDSKRGRTQSSIGNGDAESKPSPRETSQERADRRREELKRELERKAAAGPAKKKRKF